MSGAFWTVGHADLRRETAFACGIECGEPSGNEAVRSKKRCVNSASVAAKYARFNSESRRFLVGDPLRINAG